MVMWEYIVEIVRRKAINLSVHGTMATYRKVNVQYLLWICVYTFWIRGSYTLWFFEHMQQILVMYVRQVRNECEVSDLHTYMYHCHGGSNSVDSKFIAFLAWQTWEVLYNMFKLLCRNFTTQNPVYYVSPLHLNGSAVEILFSQLKFISNRDLCATRYPQALNFDHQRKCTQRESCR